MIDKKDKHNIQKMPFKTIGLVTAILTLLVMVLNVGATNQASVTISITGLKENTFTINGDINDPLLGIQLLEPTAEIELTYFDEYPGLSPDPTTIPTSPIIIESDSFTLSNTQCSRSACASSFSAEFDVTDLPAGQYNGELIVTLPTGNTISVTLPNIDTDPGCSAGICRPPGA